MPAAIVNAAELVKVAVTGQTFGLASLTVERSWGEWDLELTKAEAPRLDIAPVRHTATELETRGHLRYEIDVDACLRQLFPKEARAADGRIKNDYVDPLAAAVEAAHEFLAAKLLGGDSPWVSCEILWCPNKRHLRTMGQFTGLIRLTYETSVELPA